MAGDPNEACIYVLLLLLLLLCVRRRNCLHLEAAGYFHHFEFAEI